MEFLIHGRLIFRQALTQAIRNHIPEGVRIPLALALVLMGSCYAIGPEVFGRGRWGQPVQSRIFSPEDYLLYVRCTGVLMLIAGGILLEFA